MPEVRHWTVLSVGLANWRIFLPNVYSTMFHIHLLCMLGEWECTRQLLCDPSTIRDPWNLFPQKVYVSSWYILQKSIVGQYCCWRCNFGGKPVCIHFKMCYHASRRNGFTGVQQTNPSGKNISLCFRYFLLRYFEFPRRKFFLRLMRHITELKNVVKLLSLWDCGSCCWRRWSKRDCWCCCWKRWSNGDCWCCCWRQVFPFKLLCNVLGVLRSSL